MSSYSNQAVAWGKSAMPTMDVLKTLALPVGLFILLSPGFLLNIPPVDGVWFMSGKTSFWSVIVHGILFAVVLILVQKFQAKRSGGL